MNIVIVLQLLLTAVAVASEPTINTADTATIPVNETTRTTDGNTTTTSSTTTTAPLPRPRMASKDGNLYISSLSDVFFALQDGEKQVRHLCQGAPVLPAPGEGIVVKQRFRAML